MAPDSPNSGHQAPDQEIERLAQEIGRLIQSVEPERREDLKELAYTLIREEIFERDGRGETGGGGGPGAARPRTGGEILKGGGGARGGGGPARGPLTPLGSGVLTQIWGPGLFLKYLLADQ